MSNSKKILKFFIPLTLPKYLKKSNKLFGVVNRTEKNNQLIYEYFIKDSKINHEFVNIANLTKKSNIFELKFTNCELNEQIFINFDPQLKSTELKIFKNGKETNTCNDYIIFLYDPGSNFHPHTKTWINSSQNLYARKLEKLNQHKLISKFSQFSNLLDNLIQTVYFLYIILFIDKNSIRRRSRVFSIIADWWIGFLFSAFLIFNPYFDAAEWLSSTINCLMQNLMVFLSSTITTLMGVPVGLKLNKQLTEFLGRFFLYHIYLWETSLIIFQESLPILINCLMYSGFWGISFMISFMSDMVNLFSIHITCFYVYANRIYNLEIESLKSLFRLFGGKKMNPFRNRVDSFSYNIDQLFLGTLGFCIVFFLLPTILIYYTVFLLLRIIVILIDFGIFYFCKFLKNLPIYELAYFVTGKDKCFFFEDGNVPKTGNVNVIFIKTYPSNFITILKKTEWAVFRIVKNKFNLNLLRILNGETI